MDFWVVRAEFKTIAGFMDLLSAAYDSIWNTVQPSGLLENAPFQARSRVHSYNTEHYVKNTTSRDMVVVRDKLDIFSTVPQQIQSPLPYQYLHDQHPW